MISKYSHQPKDMILKRLPDEIPNMSVDEFSLLWTELAKARSMYERAFELEPSVGEAGEDLRGLLLQRIQASIDMIDSEMESRAQSL